MVSDVSKSRRAEQGVDQSVGNCVSVGVSLEADVVRQENAAKNEGPPGLKTM
jgi:hypothetical protein